MWNYQQSTGKLTDPAGRVIGAGYSGHGDGLNNPSAEQEEDTGPIPRGVYGITRFFDDPGGKGPIVSHLLPVADTNTWGRSGFMIHGDNAAANHTASHGCIILAHAIRETLMGSNDRVLEVVA
jgi:hypothetical protein